MVDASANLGRRALVGAAKVADPGEGCLEVGLDGFELQLEAAEALLDKCQLAGDAILLAPQEIKRDRSRVVGVQELRSFVNRSSLSRDKLLPFDAGVLTKLSDLLQDDLLRLELEISWLSAIVP